MAKGSSKGWKIGLVTVVCLAAAAGGVGAASALPQAAPATAQAPVAAPTVPTASASATPTREFKPVDVGVTPTNGAEQVNPAAPVVVRATNGTLKSVTVTERKTGAVVGGQTSPDQATWTSTGELAFDTSYTVSYAALDAAGQEVRKTQTFNTVPASHEADAAVYPLNGQKVGVAQPIQITFSEPVLNKEAVENAIRITTTAGQVGAFHWYSDKMVRFRPESFWTANSTITIDMKLFGVDLGNGQIGNFNKTMTIPIGNKMVMVADSANHVADVFINDQPAQHFLVTMGDERFPSASGYLVLMDKQRTAHFVASSIGLAKDDPANYGELDVNYATRLTPSGEFIHQATDSAVAYIGELNLSHGCIGMNAEGAAWVFNNMGIGDVVQVINSVSESAAPTDGYGDWNIPWAAYPSR
ncbi:MAG: putative exported protein [Micrococcaceae bacterium]|nr:putative exported protein [Micrococcaceae bacterium]